VIIDVDLPMGLSEVGPGTKFSTDAVFGCNPVAPWVMSTANAEIRGEDDSVFIELEDFCLEYERSTLSVEIDDFGDRELSSNGTFQGNIRVKCKTIFSTEDSAETGAQN